MPLSFVQYTGNGSTRDWPVPFAYLDPSHVTTSVNGTPVSFTFTSPGTIRTGSAAPNGSIVEVRRDTPNDIRLVDFVNGSVLTEEDLDKDSNQLFYIVQEAFDLADGSLNVLEDGSYGAGNRRISNVAPPVYAADVVTKTYLETAMTSPVHEAQTARDQAVAAQGAAEAARATAQSSAVTAYDWATISSHWANYAVDQAIPSDPASYSAKHHATKAAQSASAAALSESNAASSAAEAAAALAQLDTQRDEAVAANIAAQQAKAGAEAAEADAVQAKADAETARTAAQAAQGQAESARNAAQSAEQSAGTSAANALTYKDSAINARDSAIAARDAAQGYRDSASLSAASATTAKNAAQGYRDDALAFRNQAETFRDEAQATIGEADTLDGLHALDFALAGHTHAVATGSTNGFMAAADKQKLAGIEANAQVNDVTAVNGKVGAVTLAATDVGAEKQRHYVRLKRNTPLSVASGQLTAVTWDHQVDPFNLYAGGASISVPAGAKLVSITANLAWSASSSGQRFAEIVVGGDGVCRTRVPAYSENEQSLASGPVPVSGGESVHLQVLQDSGGSLTLQGQAYVNLSMEVWF